MFWSDDRFKSTLHRVKTPTEPGVDYYGDRYSLAYFNQPNSDCIIQGPLRKYPRVTGHEFTQLAMKRNFAGMAKKQQQRQHDSVVRIIAATASAPDTGSSGIEPGASMSISESSFM